MSIVQAIILGLVQGLTEFIPISSSGHLILFHSWLGGAADTLAFDLALHVGTLVALTAVFGRELVALAAGLLGRGSQVRLARLIALGTIPAVIAGMLLQELAASTFRSNRLVAINLMVVAVVMLVAEKYYRGQKSLKQVNAKDSLAIGIAQAVALVPGVSRSGITITTGMFAGFDRVAATRFSFLLSVPIILGASLKVLLEGDSLAQLGDAPGLYAAGALAAAISGWWAIKFLLNYLSKYGLSLFAYYRLIFGALILLFS